MNRKLLLFLVSVVLCLGLSFTRAYVVLGTSNMRMYKGQSTSLLSPTPVFRYPVVVGVPISGYFDHSQANRII